MSKKDKRELDERFTTCFVDFGMKTVTGLLIGSMMGSFFLRGSKKWPMFIGGGLGFGMAYINCENSLNNYLLSMDPKACKINGLCLERSTLKTLFFALYLVPAGHFPAILALCLQYKGKFHEAS